MAKIDTSGLTKEQIKQLREVAKKSRQDNRKAQASARKAERGKKAKAAKKDATKYYTKRNNLLTELKKQLTGTDLGEAITNGSMTAEKAFLLLAEMPERKPTTDAGWIKRHKIMTEGKPRKRPIKAVGVSEQKEQEE